MLRNLSLCGAFAIVSSLAMAQAPKAFVGKWDVEWEFEKNSYEATMVVTDSGGTWQTAAKRRSNPCFGREVPLQFDNVTATTLDMTLKFSDVIPDCKNVKVKLQVDANGVVTGQRSNLELKLKRQ